MEKKVKGLVQYHGMEIELNSDLAWDAVTALSKFNLTVERTENDEHCTTD